MKIGAKKKRNIIIVLWLEGSAGRKQLTGILRYVNEGHPWSVHLITIPRRRPGGPQMLSRTWAMVPGKNILQNVLRGMEAGETEASVDGHCLETGAPRHEHHFVPTSPKAPAWADVRTSGRASMRRMSALPASVSGNVQGPSYVVMIATLIPSAVATLWSSE